MSRELCNWSGILFQRDPGLCICSLWTNSPWNPRKSKDESPGICLPWYMNLWSNWHYLVCWSECKWGCIVGGRCRKKAIWWMAAIKMKQGRSSSKFVVQDTLPCAEGPCVGSDKLVESRKWITNFGSVRGGQSPLWIIKTLLHHQHCLETERRQIWTSAQRKTESICTHFPSSHRPSPNT